MNELFTQRGLPLSQLTYKVRLSLLMSPSLTTDKEQYPGPIGGAGVISTFSWHMLQRMLSIRQRASIRIVSNRYCHKSTVAEFADLTKSVSAIIGVEPRKQQQQLWIS